MNQTLKLWKEVGIDGVELSPSSETQSQSSSRGNKLFSLITYHILHLSNHSCRASEFPYNNNDNC